MIRLAPLPATPRKSRFPLGRIALGELVARSIELPTVPTVAASVIRALEDPRTSSADLAKIIQTDQGIASRVLRTANGAVYGLSRKVKSVQAAVGVLGFIEVRDLVVASSTRYLYKRFGETEKRMWEHSVAMAVGTRMIAGALAPGEKEGAYIAGQMHDVGKVVMNNADPNAFAQSQAAAKLFGECAAEQDTFGFSHTDVGAVLAAQWRMPAVVEAACFHHHDLAMARSLAPGQASLVACVVLADAMCHRLGLQEREERSDLESEEADALSLLGARAERLEALTADFAANVGAAAEY